MPTKPTSPWHLPAPQLQWSDDGAPFSQEFDDIYFSRADGLQETDYVFLQQNHLEQRWRALDPAQPDKTASVTATSRASNSGR